MRLFKWFRRSKGDGEDDGGPPGLEGGLRGPTYDAFKAFVESGGEHPVQGDLESFRYAAQSEAIAIARAGHDPALWVGNELKLDYERGLAHDHEALRSVARNHASRWLGEQLCELHNYARDVVLCRQALALADDGYARLHVELEQSTSNLRADPLELGRHYRSRSFWFRFFKWTLVAVFVATEFVLTGAMFDEVFTSSDNPPPRELSYLLAIGVMVLLVVVPHYAARGLKEGFTQFHGYDEQFTEEQGGVVTARQRRARAHEEQDDRGFRIAATTLGLVLLALIIPLSFLRAEAFNLDWPWAVLFLLLQVAISGYFFLREWYDHSQVSADHEDMRKQFEGAAKRRVTRLNALATATQEYNDIGEQYLEVARSAPRWDAYIVSAYWSTLRFVRHLIGQHSADLAPFVNAAETPQLAGTGAPARGIAAVRLSPTSDEHPELEELIQESVILDGDQSALDRLYGLPSPTALLCATLAANGLPCEYRPPVASDTD